LPEKKHFLHSGVVANIPPRNGLRIRSSRFLSSPLLDGIMLHYWTAGESHGPALTAIVDGFPAGLSIDPAKINQHLRRRQGG